MFFLGIDFGTSGARSCVIDAGGTIVAEDKRDFGALEEYERAGIWREALWDLLAALPAAIRTQLSTAEDALEFILVGASAVQIGTANLVHPQTASEVVHGIRAYLLEHRIDRVCDLVGLFNS